MKNKVNKNKEINTDINTNTEMASLCQMLTSQITKSHVTCRNKVFPHNMKPLIYDVKHLSQLLNIIFYSIPILH